jgi:hypothetical protein
LKIRAWAVLLVLLALPAVAALAFRYGLGPQRYTLRQDLSGVTVFIRDQEALIFIAHDGVRSRSPAGSERLSPSLRVALLRAGLGEIGVLARRTTVHRLVPGRHESQLVVDTPVHSVWSVEHGAITARPSPDTDGEGFRWTGSGIERVDTPPPDDAAPEVIDESEDASPFPVLSRAQQEAFARAGWRAAAYSGFEGGRGPFEVAVEIEGARFVLSLRSGRSEEADADGLRSFVTTVALAGGSLSPNPQVLLQAGALRVVTREEFEGLTVIATPGATAPHRWAWLRSLVPIACAVLALWLAWKGPTRALKIVLAVFVFAWIAPWVMTSGPSAIALALIPIGFGFVAMLLTTQLVAYRVPRVLRPASEDACPRYAVARVRELTADFEALGFVFHGDRETTWRMMSTDRRTFIRLLHHPTGRMWAEIHAMDEPRSIGRLIATVTNQCAAFTGDLQSNQELLRDPATRFLRARQSASCAEMVRMHESFTAALPGTVRPVSDPVAANIEAYGQWVDGLVRTGQVSVAGEWYRISTRAALPITLRVMGAWFH